MIFSYKSRGESLQRMREETFDYLIIGGGITGAAVARSLQMRGLKVALVEKGDFACQTSSHSSKLIHGGLRYLEQLDFSLVFEALSERAHLLRTSPHLVHPLPFYLPVYKGDPRPRWMLALGLWLYDFLALFRYPGTHRYLSRRQMLREVKGINPKGLRGGFQYFDARMWDDLLTVENARSAYLKCSAIATYTEAVEPIFSEKKQIMGFKIKNLESANQEVFSVYAKRTIFCLGPFTDSLKNWFPEWQTVLAPSRGTHLVFHESRLPVRGAVVMSHPVDRRISFVIPRRDFGEGLVWVGTTDGPVIGTMESPEVPEDDIDYLLDLLNRFFPDQKLGRQDVIGTTIGVRPLVKPSASGSALQQVSREHTIERGPGGSIWVAGGKYTTHRTMAEEIADYALAQWSEDANRGLAPSVPRWTWANMDEPLTLGKTDEPVKDFSLESLKKALRKCIQRENVMRMEDFYLRRIPLLLSSHTHGMEHFDELFEVFFEERGLPEEIKSQRKVFEKSLLESQIARISLKAKA